MIGTALAVGSMVMGAVNQIKAGQAAKEAARKLEQRKTELDLEYKYDYNLDFLNTPMAKSAISQLSQKYIENARKVAQGNVISGASDERAVAANAKLTEPLTDSITKLAGYGQQRQDSLRAQKLYADQNLFGLEYGAEMNKSQGLMNAGSNAFGAAGAISMADAYGGFDKPDTWLRNLMAGKAGKVLQGASQISGLAAPTLGSPIKTPGLWNLPGDVPTPYYKSHPR
jgi:hypothetical protein